jgi:hypothetical protein
MSRPLDDLHPIAREAALQLRAEAQVLKFHEAVDGGRGAFTSLLATQELTNPGVVRALLDCFAAQADTLGPLELSRANVIVLLASGFLLGVRLKKQGLV